MIKITENKNYIWIVPLISGIIAIIGILTPMVYQNIIEYDYGILKADMYWWIWCFVSMSMSYNGYNMSENRFVSDSGFLIASIITTVIIILVAINLFVLAKSTKTKKLDTKHFNSSIISGIGLIFTIIIYMIVIDAIVYNGVDMFGYGTSEGIHFWSEFDIGFGVIAPFISGFLAIIGAGIFKYYSKQEDEVIPIKTKTVEEKVVQVKPAIDNNLKFCHSCGSKIKKSSAYCEFCGIAQ